MIGTIAEEKIIDLNSGRPQILDLGSLPRIGCLDNFTFIFTSDRIYTNESRNKGLLRAQGEDDRRREFILFIQRF